MKASAGPAEGRLILVVMPCESGASSLDRMGLFDTELPIDEALAPR